MKKKILIIFLVFVIIGSYFSVDFIKNARKNRTWPFNSSIGLYLPQWLSFMLINIQIQTIKKSQLNTTR